MSLNLTAAGKVLTAFSGESDKLVEEIDYVRLTHKSIVDKDEYKTLLEEVKESRLAYDMEEVTEGLVLCSGACTFDGWNSNLCNQCQRVQRADGQKPLLRNTKATGYSF